MFIKLIKIVSSFLLIVIFTNELYADVADKIAEKACKQAGVKAETAQEIQFAAIETMDNMLPIKIAGAEFGGDSSIPDTDSAGKEFLCMCQMPPPIFERLGIYISFWNNIGMIDTTSIPYCFPQLGMSLAEEFADSVENAYDSILTKPGGIGSSMQFGERASAGDGVDQFVSANVHFLSFMNLMQIVSEAIFAACITVNTNIPLYITETLANWQNDEWGVLLNPEALLVANPIAVAACMADSFSTSLFQRSLDPLFWCVGSWGALYPITMNVGSGVPLSAYGMLAARMISQKFQTGQILDTTGSHMLNNACQPIPSYFMQKKDINIYPVFPHKYSKRFPLGLPSEIWGVGFDNPANLGVMTWIVYQKRDCCYL